MAIISCDESCLACWLPRESDLITVIGNIIFQPFKIMTLEPSRSYPYVIKNLKVESL